MLFYSGLLILGIIFLFFGAEWLIKGGVNFALFMGVKPVVIGLTIVATGTSLPEGVASFVAQIQYPESNIALANLVGSNIANIGLILGISALIRPIHLGDTFADFGMVLFSTAFVLILLSRGMITWEFGLLLLFFALAYMIYKFKKGDHLEEEAKEYKEKGLSVSKDLLYMAGGIVMISIGGFELIEGAKNLAEIIGIPDRVIGLSVVAVGTSLPELATSLVALYRGKEEMLLGNILGSNIANFFLILGLISLVAPIEETASIFRLDSPVLVAFTVFLGIMYKRGVIGRVWGGFVLTAYCFYIAAIYLNF